jgi:trehalase-like protein
MATTNGPNNARDDEDLVGVVKSTTGHGTGGQSAAAPSPFPPIADYAFLSDCHTGALIGPDGSVGWLCVPSFDSPSVFGTLLDRQAGYFRFAPFGINHATARAYEPGTNVLITTWKTPTGWIEVREALTMGRHDSEDQVTRTPGRRPTTTPTTCSCAPLVVSTAPSRWSWSVSRRSTTGGRRPTGSSTRIGTSPTPPGTT